MKNTNTRFTWRRLLGVFAFLATFTIAVAYDYYDFEWTAPNPATSGQSYYVQVKWLYDGIPVYGTIRLFKADWSNKMAEADSDQTIGAWTIDYGAQDIDYLVEVTDTTAGTFYSWTTVSVQ